MIKTINNRFEYFNAMTNRIEVSVIGPNKQVVTGHIMGMMLEDGSGRTFILTMYTAEGTRKIFVRG